MAIQMVGGGARHIFWGASRPGPLHVVNLGMTRTAFIGQAETAAPPSNRLLDIPVNVIQSRLQIVLLQGGGPSTFEGYGAGKFLRNLHAMKSTWVGRPLPGALATPVDYTKWTDKDFDTLFYMANGPREEELADLALIDLFFGGVIPDICGRSLYSQLFQDLPPVVGPVWAAGPSVTFGTVQRNPFVCPPRLPPFDFKVEESLGTLAWSPGGFGPVGFFGINPSQPWAKVKQTVQNAVVLMRALGGYPFPSPIPFAPYFWYRAARPDLLKLVGLGYPMPEDLARMAVTLSVITNYDTVAPQIVDEAKRQAREERQAKIMEMVGAVAVGALVSFAAPALVASIISGIQSVASAEQRIQTAKDLAKVSKAFETGDSAFAAEVDKLAKFYDEQSAARARLELERNPSPIPGSLPPAGGPSTTLLVGGGAAVAGAIALAIFG